MCTLHCLKVAWGIQYVPPDWTHYMGEFLQEGRGSPTSHTEPNGVDMYDFDGANSNKAGEIQVMSSPGEAQRDGEN